MKFAKVRVDLLLVLPLVQPEIIIRYTIEFDISAHFAESCGERSNGIFKFGNCSLSSTIINSVSHVSKTIKAHSC